MTLRFDPRCSGYVEFRWIPWEVEFWIYVSIQLDFISQKRLDFGISFPWPPTTKICLLLTVHIYAGSSGRSATSSLNSRTEASGWAEGQGSEAKPTVAFKAFTPKWRTSVQFLFCWPSQTLQVGRSVVLLSTGEKRPSPEVQPRDFDSFSGTSPALRTVSGTG